MPDGVGHGKRIEKMTSYPAFCLIEFEYADGGRFICEKSEILGFVKLHFGGVTHHVNVLLKGGHAVSVKGDYEKMVEEMWGKNPINRVE